MASQVKIDDEILGEYKLAPINRKLIDEFTTKHLDFVQQQQGIYSQMNNFDEFVKKNEQEIADWPRRQNELKVQLENSKTQIQLCENDIKICEKKISKLREEILRLEEEERIRAELKGKEFKMDGKITETWYRGIERQQKKINKLNQWIIGHRELIVSIQNHRRPEKINATKEKKTLIGQLEKIKKYDTEVQKLIREEEMRNMYIKYAYDNEVVRINSQSDIDKLVDGTHEDARILYVKCNQHHQQNLLRNYWVQIDCKCGCWNVIKKKCNCGKHNMLWKSNNVGNILIFDITHKYPQGEEDDDICKSSVYGTFEHMIINS